MTKSYNNNKLTVVSVEVGLMSGLNYGGVADENVLLGFPFTDFRGSKVRPALIISEANDGFRDFLVAYVTSLDPESGSGMTGSGAGTMLRLLRAPMVPRNDSGTLPGATCPFNQPDSYCQP